LQDLLFFGFTNTADFATIVAAFFAMGCFLLVVVVFNFLGVRSFVSIEHSEGFCLHMPLIMSAGFSLGLELVDIQVKSGLKVAKLGKPSSEFREKEKKIRATYLKAQESMGDKQDD